MTAAVVEKSTEVPTGPVRPRTPLSRMGDDAALNAELRRILRGSSTDRVEVAAFSSSI